MASDYPIWPTSIPLVPLDHGIRIGGVVNSFGGIYEQRIINELPITRSPGVYYSGSPAGVAHVGRHELSFRFDKLVYSRSNRTDNSLLNDGFAAAWKFYLSLFYNSSTQRVGWSPFYLYNKGENDALATWTGSDAAGPANNSRGESCTNATGRYLVRLKEPYYSYKQLSMCLYELGLDVVEVAA